MSGKTIRVMLTETVRYRNDFSRADVIDFMAEMPDGSSDPGRAAEYATMTDEQLAVEFLTELRRFGHTSDAVYQVIERNNEVIANDWDLRNG